MRAGVSVMSESSARQATEPAADFEILLVEPGYLRRTCNRETWLALIDIGA